MNQHPGTAALIGFVGAIFGFCGMGHLYIGDLESAIRLLIGGFLMHFFNILLMSVLIGFLTWPVCFLWLLYVSTMGAYGAALAASGEVSNEVG